jgi:fucose permease
MQNSIQTTSDTVHSLPTTTHEVIHLESQHATPTTAIMEAETPLTRLVALKLASAAFAFFVAGTNDGSLGALTPYMLIHYNIGTGSIAILYATAFSGWVVAAFLSGIVRAQSGPGGVLVLGAVLQVCAQGLRVWVCRLVFTSSLELTVFYELTSLNIL